MYRASKFRRIVVGALLAFSFVASAPKEAEAYTHHLKGCGPQTQQPQADQHGHDHAHASSAHGEDCRDLPTGHDHGPDTQAEHCHLGHCHGAHSGWVGSVKLLSFAQLHAGAQGFVVGDAARYRNPHLSLPFQPPCSL